MVRKRVYIKSLSLTEVLRRIDNGKTVYFDDYFSDELEYYCKKVKGHWIKFDADDIPNTLGFTLDLSKYSDGYFIDEEDAPEADDNCIGKLCKFWDNEEFNEDYMITTLDKIVGIKYIDPCGQIWNHCKPLTQEETKALTK